MLNGVQVQFIIEQSELDQPIERIPAWANTYLVENGGLARWKNYQSPASCVGCGVRWDKFERHTCWVCGEPYSTETAIRMEHIPKMNPWLSVTM